MAEILLQISNFKFSAAATRQLKFVSHGDVLGTNCLRPLLQVGAPPQQAPLLRRGLATREQLAVITDPRPDGLLMLRIMPFVPPYVHLSLRLRLVCKTWNELIVADPWSRTSAPLTSMQCTHATADYMLHYDSRRLDEFVDNWSLCFPMLTSLDFTWNRFLDDAMLISIAQTMCHKLQALSVHGCRKLLQDGMVAVSEHCDLLESIDVGHTLIRMDAVIQVIERNDQLALLRSAHEALTITKDSS